MSAQPLKKIKVNIKGMHCASCEVLIERKFKKVAGVEKVNVSHADGVATLYCSHDPSLTALQNSIADNGYSIASTNDQGVVNEHGDSINTSKDYFQIGAIFLIVVAVYLIGSRLSLIPQLGITDNMSYGFVFLIGLVAAMSTCIAVTGGLLLAVAAKYNEANPNLSGWQKFKPNIYFNVGRVISYTVLGGVIGALGSVLTLSPRINGFVTIGASLVMILLGFQLLKLFPWMRRFQPKMPKFIAHKVHEMSEGESKTGPFLLGASTFFLPCGFTQALQLYVLSKGDPVTGALTMLVFSLGTLPALLSLSAFSSFIKGTIQSYFLKFAGAVVILLGFFNISNGLTLAGVDLNVASAFQNKSSAVLAASDANVQIVGGKQIVNMKVTGLSYSPYQFTVAKGVPVEWHIDGSQAQGCAQVITVPSLGITQYLSPQKETVITFTPQSTGTIPFNCTMGMTTRGSAFTVIENTQGIVAAATDTTQPTNNSSLQCNPEIMNCNIQKASIEVSQELGIYPRSITVKKGIPVELTINDKVPLGGCMSVWVIPEYNITVPMKLGEVKTTFTPTKTGPLAMTCSMGGKMLQIDVTD